MKIYGEYRDIVKHKNGYIMDTGWRSNTIVADYGRFLAALMKRDFPTPIGLEYMAVGNRSDNTARTFMELVRDYFTTWINAGHSGPQTNGNTWVWAKKIDPDDMKYLDSTGNEVETVTNRLKVEVIFGFTEPSGETWNFKEFVLVGIPQDFDTNRLFFVNHIDHEQIQKTNNTKLTRTVKLTFPIEE